MKILKTILTIIVLTITSTGLYAQGLGARAGINFQNINGKDIDGDKLENSLKVGFNAGLNYEIPVGTDIYFQPGLLFSTKGADVDREIDLLDYKLSVSYIELPLNVVFKPLLGTGHMLLGFGPYVAYGVGGKAKADDDEYDVEFTKKVELGDPIDVVYLKAFDAGANFIIGYEMSNMLSVQLNAQLGLVNFYPESYMADDDTAWKNTGFGLSIGYRF